MWLTWPKFLFDKCLQVWPASAPINPTHQARSEALQPAYFVREDPVVIHSFSLFITSKQ